MQWQWNHNPVESAWSLTERPGWLRLKTIGISQELHQAQGMLTQRIFADQEQASTGTIRIDVSHLQIGDRAGICIFQDPYAMICVERTSKKGYQLLWKEKGIPPGPSPNLSLVGREENTGAKTIYSSPYKGEVGRGSIYLRASIRFGENKARFYYSLDNKTWEQLGEDTQQSFNLSVFVGSRFGIFCYATKQQGGYADFDWFSTED